MGDVAKFLVQSDPDFRKARLPALYSDFRPQRSLNPDGFHANVRAWWAALSLAAWEGKLPTSSSTPNLLVVPVDDRLLRSLEYQQLGRPLALGAVIKQGVLEKELIPIDSFLHTAEGVQGQSWLSMPRSVLSWAFQHVLSLGGAESEDVLPQGRFVVLKNVEAVSTALAEYASNRSSVFSRVFTKAHFHKTFSQTLVEDKRLSECDIEVLLKYATRDKGLLAYDGKTVRIRSPGAGSDNGVTEEDAAISSLKELIEDLKSQTALMESRIEELKANAKAFAARNNRISALALLKTKKIIEGSLEKRHATLWQLEQVADKIQQAADQTQLVEVMEASTVVLNKLNQRTGGLERVEEVVVNLREQMSGVDEVGNVLAAAGPATIDEAELDDELAAMEAQERSKVQEAEKAAAEAQDIAVLEARLKEIPKGETPLPSLEPSKEAEAAERSGVAS